MKKFYYFLTMMLIASCACFTANAEETEENTAPVYGEVYYVATGIFDSVDAAHKSLESSADVLSGSILEAQIDGKTVYFLTRKCFLNKEKAEAEAKEIKEFWSIKADIIPHQGLAKCVEEGKDVWGDPFDLTPIE